MPVLLKIKKKKNLQNFFKNWWYIKDCKFKLIIGVKQSLKIIEKITQQLSTSIVVMYQDKKH